MTTSWQRFFSANEMHKSESLTELSYECVSTKEHALDLLARWQQEFVRPSEVRFIAERAPDSRSVGLPESAPVLEDELDHFLTTEAFRLVIIIDKTDLQPSLDFDCSLLVFSDLATTLECIKTDSLEALESTVFPSHRRPTVIYLLEASSVYLTNGALSVCSPSTISRIDPEFLSKSMQSLNDKRRLRNENVRWNDDSEITPDHLIFSDYVDDMQPLVYFLHSWAVKLCVVFLATYTFRLDEGNFASVFTGWREIRFESRLNRDTNESDVKSLFALYGWVYGEKTPDKLGLLQQTVSMEIDTQANEAVDLLLRHAGAIYRLVQNGFRKYTEKSIREYLQERKQVEEFAKATSTDVNQQLGQVTDLMTKNLTGVLTAALGSTLAYYSSTLKHIVPIALYATGGFILLLTVYLSVYSGTNVRNIVNGYTARIALFRESFVEDNVQSTATNEEEDKVSPKVTALQIAEKGVEARVKVFWWFFFSTIGINVLLTIGAGYLGWHLQQTIAPSAQPPHASQVSNSAHQSTKVAGVPAQSVVPKAPNSSAHH